MPNPDQWSHLLPGCAIFFGIIIFSEKHSLPQKNSYTKKISWENIFRKKLGKKMIRRKNSLDQKNFLVKSKKKYVKKIITWEKFLYIPLPTRNSLQTVHCTKKSLNKKYWKNIFWLKILHLEKTQETKFFKLKIQQKIFKNMTFFWKI